MELPAPGATRRLLHCCRRRCCMHSCLRSGAALPPCFQLRLATNLSTQWPPAQSVDDGGWMDLRLCNKGVHSSIDGSGIVQPIKSSANTMTTLCTPRTTCRQREVAATPQSGGGAPALRVPMFALASSGPGRLLQLLCWLLSLLGALNVDAHHVPVAGALKKMEQEQPHYPTAAANGGAAACEMATCVSWCTRLSTHTASSESPSPLLHPCRNGANALVRAEAGRLKW